MLGVGSLRTHTFTRSHWSIWANGMHFIVSTCRNFRGFGLCVCICGIVRWVSASVERARPANWPTESMRMISGMRTLSRPITPMNLRRRLTVAISEMIIEIDARSHCIGLPPLSINLTINCRFYCYSGKMHLWAFNVTVAGKWIMAHRKVLKIYMCNKSSRSTLIPLTLKKILHNFPMWRNFRNKYTKCHIIIVTTLINYCSSSECTACRHSSHLMRDKIRTINWRTERGEDMKTSPSIWFNCRMIIFMWLFAMD